jgi:hypothetical protein
MKVIVTSAILTSFSSRVDKSLGFRGVTPELSSSEKTALMDFQGLNVRLLIEPVDFPTDGKMEVKSVLDTKTPSQRLRGVLFVWWSQLTKSGKMDKPFLQFYNEQLERILDDLKQNLEPEL